MRNLCNVYRSRKYDRCSRISSWHFSQIISLTCKIVVATTGSLVKGCLTTGMKPDSGQPLHLSRDDTTSLKFIRRLASSRFNAPHRTGRALYIYRCPRVYTKCADFPRIYLQRCSMIRK